MSSTSIQGVTFNLAPGQYSAGVTISISQAERMTGMSRSMILKLRTGGFLPDMAAWRFINLAQREVIVDAGGRQPILRTDSAETFDELDGRTTGCNTHMDDDVLTEASRGSWRCSPERLLESRFLPVSVGTVTVAALRLIDVDERVAKRVESGFSKNGKPFSYERFTFRADLIARLPALGEEPVFKLDATAEERSKVNLMFGAIQRSKSGGPIAYL